MEVQSLMNEKNPDMESSHNEIEYYKRRIEELAGENLKYDISVSGLKHELRQRRKGFALLSELQKSIGEQIEISSLFEVTIQAINATMGMDKSLILNPTEKEHVYKPGQWHGFRQKETEHFSSLTLCFPEGFADGSDILLVSRSAEVTPLIEDIRSAFELPFFICLPIMVEKTPIALLLSGRLLEAKPFYPPLEQGDVDTFQAIADLITATIRNRRLTVLKEMDRLKTEFFANISHEFRTPITLTLGPLEQILKGRYGDYPDAVRCQLQVAERNQERLLGLVNQILDLSKLEAGRMQLKASLVPDINHFIEERIGPFCTLTEKRGVELRTRLNPELSGFEIYVDGEKLEKLIYNLMSNAIKFTKEGHVEVSTEIHDGKFRLNIKDTGIGIKSDQLPHIFDRFRQADGSESRDYAGTGLGLALVKEIAHLHGGEVTVHSQYGKGSQFHVMLPLGKAHLDPSTLVNIAEESPTTDSEPQRVIVIQEGGTDQEGTDTYNKEAEDALDSAKPVILYVEDNPDLRMHIRNLLIDHYNVFLASDGQDGLSKVRRYKPDLILTDQMMPRMSGNALLRAIRNDPKLRGIPIVFLTAKAGKEARIDSLDAGADDYIAKPFDEGELLVRIRNLLNARAQERELADLNERLTAKIASQTADLELAAQIQKILLPRASLDLDDYAIAGKNIPAKQVGGDYYDFIPLDDHRIGITLGDVCGKGLPASLLMANLQATVRGQGFFNITANQCLVRANKLLYHSTDRKTFVSLFYGILDTNKHTLYYANAGQNPPLLFSPGAAPVALEARGIVLGAMEASTYEQSEIALQSGDFLMIHSDGLNEAVNEQSEEFGEKRLREIPVIYQQESADELVERILSAVKFFIRDAEQHDDMTLVILKRK